MLLLDFHQYPHNFVNRNKLYPPKILPEIFVMLGQPAC